MDETLDAVEQARDAGFSEAFIDLAVGQDEVADGLQSDPAYEEWAEAMRAADAGAWDEA